MMENTYCLFFSSWQSYKNSCIFLSERKITINIVIYRSGSRVIKIVWGWNELPERPNTGLQDWTFQLSDFQGQVKRSAWPIFVQSSIMRALYNTLSPSWKSVYIKEISDFNASLMEVWLDTYTYSLHLKGRQSCGGLSIWTCVVWYLEILVLGMHFIMHETPIQSYCENSCIDYSVDTFLFLEVALLSFVVTINKFEIFPKWLYCFPFS